MALTPDRILIDGRPHWLFPEGLTLPVISGGADDGGGNGGDGNGPPPGDPDPANSPAAGSGAGGGDAGQQAAAGAAAGISFTPEQQAHIDKLINAAFGKGAAKGEKDVKDYLERAGLDEKTRAERERDEAREEAERTRREALADKVTTRAERAALTAGVDPKRVDRFLRLVDLDDLDSLAPDGKIDDDAIAKLVGDELAGSPEFKAGPGAPASSGGEHTGGGDNTQWTREAIAKLSPAEFAKHETEIMAQMKAGSIK